MVYTIADFVKDLEKYPVGVKGLPENIEPNNAAEKFGKLKISLNICDLRGCDINPEALFTGFFPKYLLNEEGKILFELGSYSFHQESSGYPLTIYETALKYL